jgi:chromosome segregation ATPase
MQMLSDCSQKIAVSLDGLGNQVLESKSNMAKSRSEAAARHADLEAELKQRHLEISDLNNRVGSLMRENASLAESIEKANRVIQLLEGQISEKSIQNETLRKQIENQPQLVDRFNILTDQLQEVKAEIKKSWANTPVSNET